MFKSLPALPILQPVRPVRLLPTGFRALDALLGGGIAKGQLVEISGAASSGKSSLALGICLRALADGQAAAWMGTPGTAGAAGFWPLLAVERERDLSRLLVLRLPDGPAMLRAAQLLFSCPGAVRVAVLDLPAGFTPRPVELARLGRLAERASAPLLILTCRAPGAGCVGPPIGLRLHVRRPPGLLPAQAALHLCVVVLRRKGGPILQSFEEPIDGPDRLRPHCSV